MDLTYVFTFLANFLGQFYSFLRTDIFYMFGLGVSIMDIAVAGLVVDFVAKIVTWSVHNFFNNGAE